MEPGIFVLCFWLPAELVLELGVALGDENLPSPPPVPLTTSALGCPRSVSPGLGSDISASPDYGSAREWIHEESLEQGGEKGQSQT